MKYKLTALLLFLAYVYFLVSQVGYRVQVEYQAPERIATLILAGCVEAGAALCYAIAKSRPEIGDRVFVLALIEFVVSAVVLGLASSIAPWALRYSAVLIGGAFQGDAYLRIWRAQ